MKAVACPGIFLSLTCLAACAPASPWPAGEVIDLTHPFDERTIYWPTEPPFRHELYTEGMTDAGYWYASGRFAAAEHGGTHVDAPYHFHPEGSRVDALTPDRLIGPGVLIDVTEPCRADRDHRVDVEELRAWEDRHGAIPPGAIVLIRTGFGDVYPDPERYLGTADRGAEAVGALHFPGLHPDAARWLATERDIRAVGLDTPSIDHGPSTAFEAHVALFDHDVPAFENVAHLDRLPPRGFTVIALPMLIRGGTGAPIRIIAVLDAR